MEFSVSSNDAQVSVIVPFHNAAHSLARTLESISAQIFSGWETVLVDDQSTDASATIAARYASTDHRFRLIRSQGMRGAAAARNLGIQQAQGRWIAFLDADDTWHSDKLASQMPVLASGAPIVFSSYERVTRDGRSLGVVQAQPRISYRDALSGNPIGCLTAVWDSHHFGKRQFPPLRMHEDYAFWLSLLRDGTEAHGLPQVLARYQVAPGSLSAGKIRAAASVFSILRAEPGMSNTRLLRGFGKYAWISLRRRAPSLRRG